MNKYYGLNKLLVRLKEEGLPHTQVWLWKMQRNGRLSLPKVLHAPKRYALTEGIIEDVIEGLKTQGEYHFERSHLKVSEVINAN